MTLGRRSSLVNPVVEELAPMMFGLGSSLHEVDEAASRLGDERKRTWEAH